MKNVEKDKHYYNFRARDMNLYEGYVGNNLTKTDFGLFKDRNSKTKYIVEIADLVECLKKISFRRVAFKLTFKMQGFCKGLK